MENILSDFNVPGTQDAPIIFKATPQITLLTNKLLTKIPTMTRIVTFIGGWRTNKYNRFKLKKCL